MIRRSTAIRLVAPLLFSVLIAGRLNAWYSDQNQIQVGYLAYQSTPTLLTSHQLATNGSLANILSTAAPPPPQLEMIETNRTGHPINGIPHAYQPKYDEGYTLGYATGYDSGYVTGKERGTSEGTANGRSDGYNKGWGETYQPAFDLAFNAQLPVGQTAGWNQGQIDGFAEGYDWAPTLSGSAAVTTNIHNWGSSGGVMMTSGYFGPSNFHLLSPDEVPTFYYNLGLDDGNEKGTSDGSSAGYKVTYPDAYAAAYPIGYQNGTLEGNSQGSADGKSEGYSSGWKLGYAPGFDSGFAAGIQSYLSGSQSSFLSGTLKITLGSEPNVPEPTSMALLCVATMAIAFRRTARK